LETVPTATTAVVIRRADVFGTYVRDGFRPLMQSHGITVTKDATFPLTGLTVAGLKTIIQNNVVDNPQVIAIVARPGEVKLFYQAYTQLRDDTTWTHPSNFDTIHIFDGTAINGDYSD